MRFSGLAFELAVFNFLIIWGGYELDAYMDFNFPVFIILAVFLSVTGTIYYLLRRLK